MGSLKAYLPKQQNKRRGAFKKELFRSYLMSWVSRNCKISSQSGVPLGQSSQLAQKSKKLAQNEHCAETMAACVLRSSGESQNKIKVQRNTVRETTLTLATLKDTLGTPIGLTLTDAMSVSRGSISSPGRTARSSSPRTAPTAAPPSVRR